MNMHVIYQYDAVSSPQTSFLSEVDWLYSSLAMSLLGFIFGVDMHLIVQLVLVLANFESHRNLVLRISDWY